MKVPYYKAKLSNSEHYVNGFIFAFPKTTYCIGDKEVGNSVCFVSWKTTDWGLPNEPIIYQVELDTLTQIGWFDTDTRKFEEL